MTKGIYWKHRSIIKWVWCFFSVCKSMEFDLKYFPSLDKYGKENSLRKKYLYFQAPFPIPYSLTSFNRPFPFVSFSFSFLHDIHCDSCFFLSLLSSFSSSVLAFLAFLPVFLSLSHFLCWVLPSSLSPFLVFFCPSMCSFTLFNAALYPCHSCLAFIVSPLIVPILSSMHCSFLLYFSFLSSLYPPCLILCPFLTSIASLYSSILGVRPSVSSSSLSFLSYIIFYLSVHFPLFFLPHSYFLFLWCVFHSFLFVWSMPVP